jgi:hypothetical protein
MQVRDKYGIHAQMQRVPAYVQGTMSSDECCEFEASLVGSARLAHEVELECLLRQAMLCAARRGRIG